MTATARLGLEDCRLARSELVDGLQGPQWRIRIFTVLALLRASMHAVKKVDAVTEPMKSANATVWSERNTDPIFKDFIDEDRNLLLKQYQLRAGQNVTVNMGPTPRSEITYTINGGPFEGQDPRELVDRAITWISDYLDEVDRRTRAAKEPVAGEPDSRARIPQR